MILLLTIIVLALVFDFINGFHDAANSIATVVTTRVLSPVQAVVWAAFFNFMAFFIAKFIIGEFGIADTVSKTVIEEYVTLPIVFSALIAAIFWNLLTWWFGIPSSSSHTLIGAFAGAAIASAGFQSIHSGTILIIASFIVIAPVIGLLSSVLISAIIMHLFRRSNPHKSRTWFKRLQLVSSGLLSIGHGLNDSQKVMGIIAAAMIAYSTSSSDVPSWLYLDSINNIPDWVPLSCFTVIALGTLSGGWKIIKTMGTGITRITPMEGLASQTASSLTLFIVEIFKIPVSTTHVITGSIMGAGAIKRLSAVRWGVSQRLVTAWILTIPVSAVIAALVYYIVGIWLY